MLRDISPATMSRQRALLFASAMTSLRYFHRNQCLQPATLNNDDNDDDDRPNGGITSQKQQTSKKLYYSSSIL